MSDNAGESDLRRRAAWLLAMLAVVAVLFAFLLIKLLGSGGGGSSQGGGPDDALATSAAPSSSPRGGSNSSPPHKAKGTRPTTGSSHAPASCPTRATCALGDDIGNSVAAINAYRLKNNQRSIPGAVSEAAQKCALGNGNGCRGGYAESQVTKPTGKAVVAKISGRAKLLDPSMKSFEVGWAYDPTSKQYFFAVIRDS